jgi:hypothetical protein
MEEIQHQGIQGIFSNDLTEREAKIKEELIKERNRKRPYGNKNPGFNG